MSEATDVFDPERSGPVYGSGDFLADRGHADPSLFRTKILMAAEVGATLRARGITQVRFAAMSGLSQPDVSRIVNLRVKGYSLDRLIQALRALGKDVTVGWADSGRDRGEVTTERTVGASEAKG